MTQLSKTVVGFLYRYLTNFANLMLIVVLILNTNNWTVVHESRPYFAMFYANLALQASIYFWHSVKAYKSSVIFESTTYTVENVEEESDRRGDFGRS